MPFPCPQPLLVVQEARPIEGMVGRAGVTLEAKTSEQVQAQQAQGKSRRLP